MTKRRYRLEAAELAAAEAAGPGRVPPPPRPAAGVVLAREAGSTGSRPEVLLVRRRDDVGFAAGAYVFPGGTVDESDADPRWADRLDPPAEEALAGAGGGGGPPPTAFVVTALRELFEETGVLLASGADAGADAAAERWRSERAELLAGGEFRAILARRRLRLAAERFVLCARWVTPEALSRRYDARFFLAESPAGVKVEPDPGELVEHLWIAPRAALDRYFDERMPMLFPTARTLAWLDDAGDRIDDWHRYFLGRSVEPLLPRLRRIGGQVVPVLPDEPGYDDEDDG